MNRLRFFVIAAVAALAVFGIPAVAHAQGTWTQLASIPDPAGIENGFTEGATVSGVGDIMVVAAGYDGVTGDTNLTRLYDIFTNTWSFGARAPVVAAEPAYGDTSHAGKIYVIGGRTGGSGNKVQQYDVDTDTWTLKADMPTARAAAATAVIGHAIYVMGGRTGSAPCNPTALDVVERYDIDTDTWSTVASLPSARSDFAAVSVGGNGGKIFVFGGCRDGVDITDIDVYNTVTNTWTKVNDLSQPRSSLMAGRVGTQIFVMGGSTGGVSGLNERYNIITNTLAFDTPMPTSGCGLPGRGETGAYSHGGLIYVPAGGCPFAGTPTNVNWAFKP